MTKRVPGSIILTNVVWPLAQITDFITEIQG